MKATEKFPFQTSFAFFTIEKNKNGGVDVKYDNNLVASLQQVSVWDKDTINKRINQQKESIMNMLSCIANSESAVELAKRNKELSIENKELKEKIEESKETIMVDANNVEELFSQCLNFMAEVYNEKGFTMSRGNSVLNKYKEHK